MAGGLSSGIDVWLRNRAIQKRQEEQDKAITLRQRAEKDTERGISMADEVRNKGARLSDFGPADIPLLRMHLGPTAERTDAERAAPVLEKVGQDTTNSQIQAMLDKAQVDTQPNPWGQMPHGGSPEDLPSTQFGPVAAKPYTDALQARQEAGTSADAAFNRKLAQGSATTYEDRYQTGQANEDVAANNFDASNTRAGQEAFTRAYNTGLGANDPNVAALEADKAAGVTGAQEDAKLTPERVSGRVNEAGRRAGAEAGARQPFEMARMKEQQALHQAGMKEIEKWKLDNTVTGTTKTMMEGAKMLLPRIDDVAKEAAMLEKSGQFGPIMSRVRQLALKVGKEPEEILNLISSDPELHNMGPLAGRFATEAGLMASGAGRVHGGARGGGSISMVEYMKGLINDSSTADIFLDRLKGVRSYMEDYAAGPLAEPKSHFNENDYRGPSTAPNPAASFLARPGGR